MKCLKQQVVMCNWIAHRLDHQVFDDVYRGELSIRRYVVACSIHAVVVGAFAALPMRFTHTAALVVHIGVDTV